MTPDADMALADLMAEVGRVRRWLVALSALRIAAFAFVTVSLYVGVYAWIDHHVHFERAGRIVAFVLFLSLLAAGLYYVVRVLRRETTFASAAGYIENRRSFDQQLVAAVEYFEGRGDYPYSPALARQLVVQVAREAQDCRLDATVQKWQGYLLAGLLALCMVVVGLFVRQNALYVSAYLSRLVRPLAQVQPIPNTTVCVTSGEVVAATKEEVTLSAAVEGRVPDVVTLVLSRPDPDEPNHAAARVVDRVDLTPDPNSDGSAEVSTTCRFEMAQCVEYRFEAGDASSGTYAIQVCERPSIERITASVTPPAGEGSPPLEPYEQEVRDGTLEVLPNSRVAFELSASMPLSEARMKRRDGKVSRQALDGDDTFGFETKAETSCSIELGLTSAEGLSSGSPERIQIKLKVDQQPQFKLVSPEGDCLVTDVASIPIAFEGTDDFGLLSARLCCELPDGRMVVLDANAPDGRKQLSLKHTLELEQYDLHVGDGLFFYATARDLDTGQRRADTNAVSELHFIEIRPYRQYWHPQPGGEPTSMPGPVSEDLLTILEYTRAIVKKTWPPARADRLDQETRESLKSLADDLEYCAGALKRLRDDREAGFGDRDKLVLDEIVEYYRDAKKHLDRQNAGAGLESTQSAYRTLRKFIDELHLNWTPPPSGQSVPQDTPERVKLQERPEEPTMEKERLEGELKQMQQQIDSLQRRQQSIREDLADVLGPEAEQSNGSAPADGGAKQSGDQTGQGQGKAEQPSQDRTAQASQGGEREGASPDAQSVREGESQSPNSSLQPKSRNEATGGSSRSDGGDGTTNSSTDADARLRMLEAKQRAVREQTDRLGADMARLPASEYSAQGNAKAEAQRRLTEAVDAMKGLEEDLADARYESASTSAKAEDIEKSADSIAERLSEAGRAIRQGLSNEGQPTEADRAQQMAEQLAADAEAYDDSLSETERRIMQARLEAAKRLLESMAEARWATVASGGGPAGSHVYTRDGHAASAETARLLARQFWSLAVEAKERESRSLEEAAVSASDAEFFEAENEFFERAAKYERERSGP